MIGYSFDKKVTWYDAVYIQPKPKEPIIFEHEDGFSVGTYETGLFIEDHTNEQRPPEQIEKWAFVHSL